VLLPRLQLVPPYSPAEHAAQLERALGSPHHALLRGTPSRAFGSLTDLPPSGTSLATASAEHQHDEIFLQLRESVMYPTAVNKEEISFSVTKQIPKTYFRAFVTWWLETRADPQLPGNVQIYPECKFTKFRSNTAGVNLTC